jgi:hypothetical protein
MTADRDLDEEYPVVGVAELDASDDASADAGACRKRDCPRTAYYRVERELTAGTTVVGCCRAHLPPAAIDGAGGVRTFGEVESDEPDGPAIEVLARVSARTVRAAGSSRTSSRTFSTSGGRAT